MSASSVSNIPAQKLRPGSRVNLCIQVLCVKSFLTERPNSASTGKLGAASKPFLFYQSPIISLAVSASPTLSSSLTCCFPLQVKLFQVWLFVALPHSSSCVSAGGTFFFFPLKSHLASYSRENTQYLTPPTSCRVFELNFAHHYLMTCQ